MGPFLLLEVLRVAWYRAVLISILGREALSFPLFLLLSFSLFPIFLSGVGVLEDS